MHKSLLGGLAALALVVGAAPAMAQNVEFTIVNNSSVDLHFFYASPSNDENWGDDLLEEMGVLEAGYQATAFIGDGSDQCLYDFLFEGGDGEELTATEVDICKLDSYTLTDQ
jgi:hypothetical protein